MVKSLLLHQTYSLQQIARRITHPPTFRAAVVHSYQFKSCILTRKGFPFTWAKWKRAELNLIISSEAIMSESRWHADSEPRHRVRCLPERGGSEEQSREISERCDRQSRHEVALVGSGGTGTAKDRFRDITLNSPGHSADKLSDGNAISQICKGWGVGASFF